MTDPSYKGQFVAFTCPHIGNVGINEGVCTPRSAGLPRDSRGGAAAAGAAQAPHACANAPLCAEDMESDKCHLGAIIVRDHSITVSNYRAATTLDAYCKKQGVIGISDVDTRALTKALRDTGCLVGVISTDESKSNDELLAMAKSWTIVGKDLLSVVSCTQPYEWRQVRRAKGGAMWQRAQRAYRRGG